jgi:uncharacterized membrane protein YidH (DUF202 family)
MTSGRGGVDASTAGVPVDHRDSLADERTFLVPAVTDGSS